MQLSKALCRRPLATFGVGIGLATMLIPNAHAFGLDLGNPDLKVRWDNTFRYNLGVRAKDCDVNICGNDAGAGDITAYQSDRKFGKAGDVVTNRLDLLSELDLIFRENSGFRVSAAGWYDAAYDNRIEGDAALDAAAGGAFMGAGRTGGPYASYTKRWNIGPAGEFLDVFAFTKVDIGDVPVNIKLGQHNVYWGESLFSAVGGIAYNQGPLDFRKAIATPGVTAKEVFKPLNQLSFTAGLTDNISLAGQYFLDWKPSPLPDGGTYFGAADGFGLSGTGTVFGAPTTITGKPRRKRGDFGLALTLRPQWLDGSMGFYYREYTNKFPQLTLTALAGANPAGFGIDFSATKREKMLGFSLGHQLGGVSIGFDMTYRPDAVLAARPFATFVPPTNTDPNSWVPTGDIVTAVLNGIAYFGKTAMFDAAPLTFEVNYTRLNSVTAHPNNYNGQGYNCGKASGYGCPSRDAWGMNVMFEPKWYQVFSGIDLSAPMVFGQGLKGNSPVIFGDNEGQGSWSLGVTADAYAKYNFSLKYNGYLGRHKNDELGALSDNNAALGKWWDRDFVSFTFKTTF